MLKALLYKEWIKTRWYLIAALTVTTGFAAYSAYGIHRAVSVFIDIMQFVPLIAGILLSIFQFIPEMQRKCLKLTLHLPVPAMVSTYTMICFGVAALSICFVISLLAITIPAGNIFPAELTSRIISTALPRRIRGICVHKLDHT